MIGIQLIAIRAPANKFRYRASSKQTMLLTLIDITAVDSILIAVPIVQASEWGLSSTSANNIPLNTAQDVDSSATGANGDVQAREIDAE